MNGMNWGRVTGAGLLAGLIINVSESLLNGVVLAQPMEDAMRALNRPPVSTQMIVWFVVLGFVIGIITVWLYAAIRPRFGPGIRTAICAALTVWLLAYAYPSALLGIMQIFPADLTVIGAVWGLVELIVAGIAGAWIYTEA
jgi:hypothetical protein